MTSVFGLKCMEYCFMLLPYINRLVYQKFYEMIFPSEVTELTPVVFCLSVCQVEHDFRNNRKGVENLNTLRF